MVTSLSVCIYPFHPLSSILSLSIFHLPVCPAPSPWGRVVSWHWGRCYSSGGSHLCYESVCPISFPCHLSVCTSKGPERKGKCQGHSGSQGQVVTNPGLRSSRETLPSLFHMTVQVVLFCYDAESPCGSVCICPSPSLSQYLYTPSLTPSPRLPPSPRCYLSVKFL